MIRGGSSLDGEQGKEGFDTPDAIHGMKNLVGGDEKEGERRRVEANGKGDGRRVGGVQLEPRENSDLIFS